MRSLLILSLLSPVLLSGCGALNTQFDCPHGGSVRCQSVATLDEMALKGDLDAPPGFKVYEPTPTVQPYHPQPFKRSAQKVKRLWIAPYTDTTEQYHDGAFIYFLSGHSTWLTP